MKTFNNYTSDPVMIAARTILEGKSSVKEQEQDPGEYDYEGSMAKNALRTIVRNAQGLHDMLEDEENLPEHVQAKLIKAEEYVVSARDYIESEKNK
jgi:hypothetical protein